MTANQPNGPDRYSRMEAVLRENPCPFEFFQAVRLIERLFPDRAPVGRFVSPDKEVMRFNAHSAFPFPASQIQRILWDGDVPVLVINFMGLTGPMGVLPLYYTEMLLDRVRNRDHAIVKFFDMFNHRMISLFYQAWEKYRFTIAYERGERDKFSHHLMDLIGIGSGDLQNRLRVRDDSLLLLIDSFLILDLQSLLARPLGLSLPTPQQECCHNSDG